MRLPLLAALAPLVLLPAAARADVALVIANEDYESFPELPAGDRPTEATEGIEALGFEIIPLTDGDREETARALAQFMAAVPDSQRLVVTLSGRFVTDGGLDENDLPTGEDVDEPVELHWVEQSGNEAGDLTRVVAEVVARAGTLLQRDVLRREGRGTYQVQGVDRKGAWERATIVR